MSTPEENDKFAVLTASLKGAEPVRRRVRRDVIQSESLFLKEYIQDGATEIKIPLKRPKNLNLILEYLYEGQLTLSNGGHLESLWNDAKILGLLNLQNVCIQRLTDTISLDSWFQILEFSQTDGCHELEANAFSFVNDNFENCSSSSSFKSLNVDQMVQVLQLPIVKTTVTEFDRIALILDWIKVNEVDRCSQAHRLLEQVDLMKLTESSLRSFFDEESAFRNWRSVVIFETAIRLKNVEEAARESVQGQPEQEELIEAAGPINIKQEVASEESSSDAEVNDSTMNPEESGRECRTQLKREVSPPSPSSEAVENNENDSPRAKMPRLECSQYEIESAMPSQLSQSGLVSHQKQILYFSQLSSGATSLNSIIISADSVSQPQQVLASLPKSIHGIPKLIWNQGAGNLCFLGQIAQGFHSTVPSFFKYMNGEGAPLITALPPMLHQRHRHQPVLLNGSVYVFGGSKSLSYENNDRFSGGEVLDVTTTVPWYKWKWQPIRREKFKRDLYAAACVEGNIYVIGGAIDKPKKNEPSITHHALCYSPGENSWKKLNYMRRFRFGHALAVVGHKIYVFGGSGRNYNDPPKDLDNMKSAEVYDIQINWWTLIAPMLNGNQITQVSSTQVSSTCAL